MEFVKNRYGDDRVIEKINPTALRVYGESIMNRQSENQDGDITMFDFEGGPCLTIGGTIKFMKTKWTITSIKEEESKHEGLCSVRIGVKI